MWIVNAFLAWMLWRQADTMYEMDTGLGKTFAWICVAASAANAAVFMARLTETL